MDGDGPFVILSNFQEALENGVAGRASVHKKQVVVFEARVREPFGVVYLLVQPHNVCDAMFSEVREVSLWSVERVPYGGIVKQTGQH